MTTPAAAHYLRVTSAQAAQQSQEQRAADNNNAYELMLAKLYSDTQTLKGIQSQEAKTDKKRTLLPDYAPYIEGALQGSAPKDDVLMTIMVWHLDVGDFPSAVAIARHALAHNMPMPDRFQRNAATVLAEEVADAMLARATTGGEIAGETLVDVAALVEPQDMPDQVRAKLYKAMGLFYEKYDPESALEVFTRAFELNKQIGVKKNIEQLQRRIANEAAGA